ncbi:MAG: AgmX/PglI C-terminal domain-containing protein, partial [Pseudomonadota bacterium]
VAKVKSAEPVAAPSFVAPTIAPPGAAMGGGLVAPPGVVPPHISPQPAQQKAMPQPAAPAYVPDPTLDVQDGSQAIEVTAMFESSVMQVRQLSNPAAGKVGGATWGVLGVGVCTVLTGIVLVIVGQMGLGALTMIVGSGLLFFGGGRYTNEKKSPNYTVGAAAEADIHLVTPAIPVPCFPLVKSSGTDFGLLFTENMVGDVTVGGERTVLSQLVSSGRARPDADIHGAYLYPIPRDARIKIDMGENTFLVNSVTPARTIASPFLAGLDGGYQTSNGVSTAAHLLILFLVFAVPPDAKTLSLDLFNLDNKLLKFLVKPEQQKEEDIPDWLKKKSPDEEAGGKGQRHKGDEGKMGSKKSQKKTGLYGLKGPEKNPDPHLAKRLAEEAAKDAGVLGLLKQASGSHIASIFGRDSALGTDAEDALGGLIGNSIGEAYGAGGLGLVGTGRGGGGTGEGTIGLGALGTIGKGGGGGGWAGYGSGVGRLGGRRAGAPRVVAGQAQVRGALDKEIIRRIIRRHINEVKHCYSKELQGSPNLEGRVVIQFTISPTGQVVVSQVQNSTMQNQAVESCIAQAVRRWLFPKPRGGGIVIVSYPFVLRAAGGD